MSINQKEINAVAEIFKTFEIDGRYGDAGILRNLEVWEHNKASLMEMFAKHSNWDAEKKCIILPYEYEIPINREHAKNAYCSMIVQFLSHISPECNVFLEKLYKALGACGDQTITQEFIDRLETETYLNKEMKPVVGMKTSRYVQRVLMHLVDLNGAVRPITEFIDNYEVHFAKLSDALTVRKMHTNLVMSVNFGDFMTMSNGNSWSSCHFINSHGIFHENAETSYHGMYKQGCLSYALDEVSFIFYAINTIKKDVPLYMQPKNKRMVCQYTPGKGILVTGKLYPDNDKTEIARFRQIIQGVIAQCDGLVDKWKFSWNVTKINSFVDTVDGASHYTDYTYENQRPSISFNQDFDVDHILRIGHASYCVCCGDILDEEEHSFLQCSRHRYDNHCHACGAEIENPDDMHILNGRTYCANCCFYCDECGVHHPIREGRRDIVINGVNHTICDYAFDTRVSTCDECGQFLWNSQLIYDEPNDRYLCNHCYTVGLGSYTCVPQESYNVGDIVMIRDNLPNMVEGCAIVPAMQRMGGRIMRIRMIGSSGNRYDLEYLNGDRNLWVWAAGCFEGRVVFDSDNNMTTNSNVNPIATEDVRPDVNEYVNVVHVLDGTTLEIAF